MIVAVIPAYNEEKNIKDVIRGVKKYVDTVLVVNDGSIDRTAEIARKEGAIVVTHIKNLGLGASLKTGIEGAIRLGADIIVTIDADGQHDPNEIPKLVEALRTCEIVIGSRETGKDMPFIKKMGNLVLYWITKILFNVSIKDTQSGFRAFKSEVYNKIKWESPGYEVASEIVINIGKSKVKYKEIPINTIYIDKYKGTTIIDGIKIFMNMLKWKFGGKK